MEKILIRNLQLYSFETINDTKSIEYKKIINDDFSINNFSHFPIILDDDGSIWKHGNLYLLHKLKGFNIPSYKTLDSIANDLKHFRFFCISNNIDYLSAPRKILRPTYLYRSFLQEQLKLSKISPSTLKRKMSTLIGFYSYLINVEKIYFKFPLWENGITSISYKNPNGLINHKIIETKDILKVPSSQNYQSFDESIIDGGKLKPLDENQQIELIDLLKKKGNNEMTLGFLISLFTGARIQTVFTLRKKHFEKEISQEQEEVPIKIGLGTDCDTKFDKIQSIFFPSWLYIKIQIYLKSPRYKKRQNKSKHTFDDPDLQYVFLTNRGTPYYVSKYDSNSILYKEVPNGGAVRQFIYKYIKFKSLKNHTNFNFSFHDLRATFGLNLLNKLLINMKKEELNISYILLYIKERMGHSHLETTEKYLNYNNKNKLKINSQNNFENHLISLIDE